MEKEKIRIMMAENHHSIRQAYANFINDADNMVVTGDTENGFELLKLVEKNIPDIVILDLDMPVMGGRDTLARLKKQYPSVKSIILSMHNESFLIAQLLLEGACAYLPKDCTLQELILTINKVYKDGFYFNDSIQKIALSSAVDDKKTSLFFEKELSSREIEVLREMCKSKESKEIANSLNISVNTVEWHRKNIYHKTNSQSIVDIVKYAIRHGITNVD